MVLISCISVKSIPVETRKELQLVFCVQVYLSSQCASGPLAPELYKSGKAAMDIGVEAGTLMTPEAAVVKLMLCLAYPDIPLGVPIAGEL